MNKRLYSRLAWQNLRKNGRFYFPYLLTIAGVAAAFYILLALGGTKDLPEGARYSYLSMYVFLGAGVVSIFSVIFLFYTNSFLMKRRKKELGLYNILGMGKRHIARMLVYETIYTAVLGIGGGIIIGMLLQKLVTLLLMRLMAFDVYYGFSISPFAIGSTAVFFLAVLFLNLLYNLRRIHIQNPIELLREGDSGEKEPKTRWLLAILGVLCLGGGYYMAMTIDNALEALAYYFVAVILVIIGTYCLFVAVSIAVLKLLRRNKKIYYKTGRFIGISGMLYRMKRNAVGLANICILSTMVLVMVSDTLCLYLGTEDALDTNYPGDLNITVRYAPSESAPFQADVFLDRLIEGVESQGLEAEPVSATTALSFSVGKNGADFTLDRTAPGYSSGYCAFVTAEEYARLTNSTVPRLAQDEVIACGLGSAPSFSLSFVTPDNPDGETMVFQVAERVDSFPDVSGLSAYLVSTCYFVVADDSVLLHLYEQQAAAFGDNRSLMMWQASLDVSGTSEEEMACAQYISDPDAIHAASEDDVGSWESYRVQSRSETAQDFYSLNGGFFFLGIFLGILFIMATVLIIYYKQISEGYEDCARFQIMQKVGLEKKVIRRSVNGQILVVFFLPLLVAAIHVAFDFRLSKLLLSLFQLYNGRLFLLCTLGTLLAFALVYGAVYLLTARSYYKIVSNGENR